MEQVLSEILTWSRDRPAWQRDALRRIFGGRELADSDITDLADLCKAAHGLSSPRDAEVLGEEHVRIPSDTTMPVSLSAVVHHRGVNALAEAQTITFGDHLTIVYGANAAGKSGYSRILKNACRARAAEDVLGNVLSGTSPAEGRAAIHYQVGGTEGSTEWTANSRQSRILAAVSVFDCHCAPVYVRDKTDVAFRPFGLDVFDKLSVGCSEVRRRMEKERDAMGLSAAVVPQLTEGTEARRVLDNLSALTNTDEIRSLASISQADKTRLAQLRAMRKDFELGDPKGRAHELTLKAERVATLARHAAAICAAVGQAKVDSLRALAQNVATARKAWQVLSEAAVASDFLPGTMGSAWRKMWDAAREFSREAYPARNFPVTVAGSRCPLCQQLLPSEVAERLERFQERVPSVELPDPDAARPVSSTCNEAGGGRRWEASGSVARPAWRSFEVGWRAGGGSEAAGTCRRSCGWRRRRWRSPRGSPLSPAPLG